MSKIADRIMRKLTYFTAASKERHFSSAKWDHSWSEGYGLDRVQEDARYGVLFALMQRFELSGPILDIGCGDGLLEERFRRLSSTKIVAFDYSAVAIERAQNRAISNVEFKCADSRSYRPTEQFSLIVFSESLYYVDEYASLLKDLSRLLKRDGVFIVSMHEAPITKKIWRGVMEVCTLVHGVELKDEGSGMVWHIRVLQPHAFAK